MDSPYCVDGKCNQFSKNAISTCKQCNAMFPIIDCLSFHNLSPCPGCVKKRSCKTCQAPLCPHNNIFTHVQLASGAKRRYAIQCWSCYFL